MRHACTSHNCLGAIRFTCRCLDFGVMSLDWKRGIPAAIWRTLPSPLAACFETLLPLAGVVAVVMTMQLQCICRMGMCRSQQHCGWGC